MKIVKSCSWNRSGDNPWNAHNEAAPAVFNFSSIPPTAQMKLYEDIVKRQYYDVAEIRRASIKGQLLDYQNLRNMHFGKDTLCEQVDRSQWSFEQVERGLVFYCRFLSVDYFVLLPTVCGNLCQVDAVIPSSATHHVSEPSILATGVFCGAAFLFRRRESLRARNR